MREGLNSRVFVVILVTQFFKSSALFIEVLRDVGELPAHHFFFTVADLTPLILCLIWGLYNEIKFKSIPSLHYLHFLFSNYSLRGETFSSPISKLKNPKTSSSSSMASSSSVPELAMQDITQGTYTQQEAPTYEIKGRTMSLEEWELTVQVERPVDFASLLHHGCNIKEYYESQDLIHYFNMLNGPT